VNSRTTGADLVVSPSHKRRKVVGFFFQCGLVSLFVPLEGAEYPLFIKLHAVGLRVPCYGWYTDQA